jgi:hypothetical protein
LLRSPSSSFNDTLHASYWFIIDHHVLFEYYPKRC